MIARLDTIVLEDAAGQSALAVDWIAALRPFRFEHNGRTFDASRQLADGTWVYRTTDPPKPEAAKVKARLERGPARCFVKTVFVERDAETVEHQGENYTFRSLASDGVPIYWHG